MKLIFLHIPKTAGQSCYHFLDQCFDPDEIFPARENYQLVGHSVARLNKFRVFRGHLDWSSLDCISHGAFTFTILREPRERVISFYFFLRLAAKQLSPEALKLAHNRGLNAALNEHPDVFFCDGDPEIRVFHDNLFDNLYTYYFAGRALSARSTVQDVLARPDTTLTMSDIVDCAVENIHELSGAYRITDLDLLQRDLEEIGIRPRQPIRLADITSNVGVGDFDSRIAELRSLGATVRTFDRIEGMVEFDSKLWRSNDIFRAW
jgi:hypothetical protein